jgi:hypothetical protein
MGQRFSIGALRTVVLSLGTHWSTNVFLWLGLAAISTFTAAQVPAQASPAPHQAEAIKANAKKEAESGSCVAKSDARADRIQGAAPRDAGGNAEKVSEESDGGASAANLTLHTASTTDSTINDVQGDDLETDIHQESRSEEPARPNPLSPQQCTLSKGSREKEHVPPR